MDSPMFWLGVAALLVLSYHTFSHPFIRYFQKREIHHKYDLKIPRDEKQTNDTGKTEPHDH